MKKFLHEETFVKIGFVRKSYGYKGDVKLALEEAYVEDTLESSFIFVELEGLKVPFKVDHISDDGDIIVKFERVDSAEETESIISASLYLLEKELKHAQAYLEEENKKDALIGFKLTDITTDQSYDIIGMEEYPQQIMAVVMHNESEVLIPLNDQFIKQINEEAKTITVELPEGLLDL